MAYVFLYYHQEEFEENICFIVTKQNKNHRKVLVFNKAARSPDEVFVWLDKRTKRSDRYELVLFILFEDWEQDAAWETEPPPTLQDWPPPAWRTFLSHADPVDNDILSFGVFMEERMFVTRSFQFVNDPKKQLFTIDMDRYDLEYPNHYPVYKHGSKKVRYRYFHMQDGFADKADAKQLNRLFDEDEDVVWKFGCRKFDPKQTFYKQACAFDVNHVLRHASVTHTTPPEDLFRDRMAYPLHVDHAGNIFSPLTAAMFDYDQDCLFNYMYYLWQMWPREMRIEQQTVEDNKLSKHDTELQEKNVKLLAENQKLRALLESKGVHVP
jgi:hypothetical protein